MAIKEITVDLARRIKELLSQLELSSVTGRDRWAELFRAGQYDEALAQLERELGERTDDLRVRFWWLVMQLQLDRVPVTALLAPFDEIFPGLRETPELYPAACIASLRLASRLVERNQLRLAVVALERTAEFAAHDSVLGPTERGALSAILETALTQELERAELRREDRDYRETLRTRLNDLARLRRSDPSKLQLENSSPARPLSRSAASKAVLAANSDAFTDQAPEVSTVVMDESAGGAPERTFGEVQRRGLGAREATAGQAATLSSAPMVVRRLMVLGGGLGVILLISSYLMVAAPTDDLPLSQYASLLTEVSALPSVTAPVLRFKGGGPGASDSSHLDRLSERLKRQGRETVSVSIREGGSSSDVSQAGGDTAVDREALAKAASILGGAMPQVEKNGLEPFGNTGEPRVNPKKTPELNPDRLEGTSVDLGSLGRSTVVDGLRVGPDGRIFGPPVPPSVPLRDPSGKGYVRAHEVEQFQHPVTYRTIAPTKVLSAPSMTAVVLTELKRNSNVQVVARMGIWLELRSTSGRRGYIYAQDAERVQ